MTVKKNILLLADVHTGGEWIATERLVRALRSQPEGPRFYLVAFYDGSYPLDRQLFERMVIFPYREAPPPFSFLKTLLFNIRTVRLTATELISVGVSIDCVIVTYYLMAIAIVRMQMLSNVPRIFFFHGIRSALRWRDVRYNYRDAVVKILERLALLSSSLIVTASDFGKSIINSMLWPFSGMRSVYIVPYYYSKRFFEKAIRRDFSAYYQKIKLKKSDDVIVCLRRIAPYKGLENLIKGFALFIQTDKRAVLVIAAPSQNQDVEVMAELKQQIHNFQLEKKVKFIYNPSEDERIALYKLADLTIVPSEYEISPLVLRESILCGTPCMGTAVGDMAQVLGSIDEGLVLRDNTPKEIFFGLNQFFDRPTKDRKKLRFRLKKYIDSWDENKSLQLFLEVIDKVD